MLRDKISNTKKIISGLFIGQKGYKISSLVFGLVLAVGLIWTGVDWIINRSEKSATVSEEYSLGQIPAWWYSDYFGSSVCEQENCKPESDPDGDKLSNQQEYYFSTDPNKKDTNDNGYTDGEDVALGYVPNKPGKITFEEAASDDSIVGESLLFGSEVKDVIVGMTDLNKVAIPEISDAELTIIDGGTLDSLVLYLLSLEEVSKKYYSGTGQFSDLSEQIKMQNSGVITQLKMTAKKAREEYKSISVPKEAVQLHKYHLALWDIIPKVLEIPQADPSVGLISDPDLEKWFDNAQIMFAINQKMDAELQKLRNQYRN